MLVEIVVGSPYSVLKTGWASLAVEGSRMDRASTTPGTPTREYQAVTEYMSPVDTLCAVWQAESAALLQSYSRTAIVPSAQVAGFVVCAVHVLAMAGYVTAVWAGHLDPKLASRLTLHASRPLLTCCFTTTCSPHSTKTSAIQYSRCCPSADILCVVRAGELLCEHHWPCSIRGRK
mgnify:CR=1 FL=1